MTQKEAKLLVEIITVVVRRELKAFRKQLLSDGYTPQATPVRRQQAEPTDRLTEVQKGFRKTYKSANPLQGKRLSKDPLLNEMLLGVAPLPKEGSKEELAMLEDAYNRMNSTGLNLPTGEHGGLMHSGTNVDHVIEAMNRDYSGMFKKDQKQAPANARNQLRSNVIAMMESEDYMPAQIQHSQRPSNPMSGFPAVEPFSGDEEDLDWLNEVQ
jgi:hypothetical protein